MAHVAAASGVIRTNRASAAKMQTQPNKYEFRLTAKEEQEILPELKKTEYSSVRALGPTYTYNPATHILSPRSAKVTATIKEYRKEQESAAKSARKTAAKPPSRLRSFFTRKRKSTTAGGRKRRQRRRTRKQRRQN